MMTFVLYVGLVRRRRAVAAAAAAAQRTAELRCNSGAGRRTAEILASRAAVSAALYAQELSLHH